MPTRDRPHGALTVDTASLVAGHESEITLAYLNTGTTVFRAPERALEQLAFVETHQRV